MSRMHTEQIELRVFRVVSQGLEKLVAEGTFLAGKVDMVEIIDYDDFSFLVTEFVTLPDGREAKILLTIKPNSSSSLVEIIDDSQGDSDDCD